MPRFPSPSLPIALGLLIFSCGCGMEQETIDSITEVVNRTADSSFGHDGSSISDPFSVATGVAGYLDDAEGGDEHLAASNSFELLYPDRNNPFLYPDEVHDDAGPSTSTSVAEIQVMGFANINSDPNSAGAAVASKVLLRTNVGMKLLAVGEQVGQVTVLRIDPPAVELKMGSLIWTATMFDR